MAVKITFLGAGSSVFVRNVLGDCILCEELEDLVFALYDIDPKRLTDSLMILEAIKHHYKKKVTIEKYMDKDQLPAALTGADFVICAVQIGGYDPCTITDFEIPKKYGLRQTIGDTLGVGGVFRALRTIPVLEMFGRYVEKYCPDAVFLNYSNPMGILCGYMQRYCSSVRLTGLCHSVQVAVPRLFDSLGMKYSENVHWKIAGINHMAWLLEVTEDSRDLYPEIKRRSIEQGYPEYDMVRHEMMHRFGYYVTESSEHLSEYVPYFIKKSYPELIDRFHIPLDEYPRRCVNYIKEWEKMKERLTKESELAHEVSREYASHIICSIVNNTPFKFGGNILNKGVIPNLPYYACVEVPCISDGTGIFPVYVGELPEQLAALNRTNINVQMMAIEAAHSRKKEAVYQAVMLDPHASSELSMDDIVNMCDELFEVHKDWIPEYH